MIENIDFDNIKIPSINDKFGFNPKSHKFYLNDNYRKFKELISKSVRIKNIPGPYTVIISSKSYQDIDNAIKCILDGLQAGGCIDDDKNVLELHVRKIPVGKKDRQTLSITVQQYHGWVI